VETPQAKPALPRELTIGWKYCERIEYVAVDGEEVPALGFGTASMDTDEEREQAISAALAAGYRHLDTAQIYGSEPAVGRSVRDADINREEVFITTKLSGDNRAYDAVIDSTRESLDRLETDYIDLLLIHSPDQDVSREETLDALNELLDEGAIRHFGVSNFSVEETREAITHSEVPIFTNQIEYNVHERQDDLLSLRIDEEIMLTAYSPLGVGDLLEDETVRGIADRHERTAAQVALRWLLQQSMVAAIPMSSNPDHVRQNFNVFDFELSSEEMSDLFAIDGDLNNGLASRLNL
jgi:diketogulonate reductase-like aldo/keto reductase